MARLQPRARNHLALLAALVIVASCNDDDDSDGDSGGPIQAPPITVSAIAPGPFVSYLPVPFTLAGSGFARSGALQVGVKFRTNDGTPFAGGTAAQAQVVGAVISDTEIQGTTPQTNAPGIWNCAVEVSDAFGLSSSAQPIALFVGLTVLDIDTPEIRADVATPMEVTGLVFLPLNGNATIRFVSTIPGAFPGGSDTLDVPGTISLLRISGTTPVLSLAAPVPAFVSVILDQVPGTPQVTSACALTVFEPPPPIPVVVSSITTPLPLSFPTPFTITGSGFLGSGDPDVQVTFTATTGNPLVQGTAISVPVLGTATSDTTIVGTSPTGTSPIDVTAFVKVARSDGVSGESASAIALFTAPVETADTFTPSVFCTGSASAFTILGTNLPTPQTATVRFRALSGTPFSSGTSETADVVANITSALQIDGLSPLAIPSALFLAEVTVILPSGLELPMGIECLFGPIPQCQPPPPGLVVTHLGDSGPGSLRDLIGAAPIGGIITFQPGLAGVLTLNSTLFVPRSVEILGPGADVIRVSAQLGGHSLFNIQSLAGAVVIERLTIADSASPEGAGAFFVSGGLTLTRCEVLDNGVQGQGGGILVASGGTLTLNECTLRGNSSTDAGGAVFVSGGAAAQATGCTFDDNESDAGGAAVAVAGLATFTAVNCTFHANHTTGGPGGGAILIAPNATVNLTHCTLAENSTHNRGGAVLNHGTLIASNCIFARNSDGKGEVEISNQNGTNNTTFSLVRVGTGSGVAHGVNGNLVGTPSVPIDARLGELLANGGPTRTMALRPGSPALDSAGPASSVPKDQRGIDRPQGTASDRGAYEETVIL